MKKNFKWQRSGGPFFKKMWGLACRVKKKIKINLLNFFPALNYSVTVWETMSLGWIMQCPWPFYCNRNITYLVSVQKKRYLIHLMAKYNYYLYLPGRYLLTFFQITRCELCTSLSEFAHHLFQSPVFIKNFFNEKLSANHNLEQLFGNRFRII